MDSQRTVTVCMLYVGALVFLSSGFVAQFRSTVRKLAGTHNSSPPSVADTSAPLSDASVGGQSFFREQTSATTSAPIGGAV